MNIVVNMGCITLISKDTSEYAAKHDKTYIAAKLCWSVVTNTNLKDPIVQHSLSSRDHFGDYGTGR